MWKFADLKQALFLIKSVALKRADWIFLERFSSFLDYPNLTTLPIGSVHNVDEWTFLRHYGTERLIISLVGKLYQAGDNLGENTSS